MISIAIDGPSGSGKSTISKCLAKKLGFINVDTGALYRAIAYFFVNNGIDYDLESNVEKALNNIHINLEYENYNQILLLNGEDITQKIRSDEISMAASKLSSMQCVRDYLFNLQRSIANTNNVIMDGRDIGTVILPNATLKLFLTALPEVRAKRRYIQLVKENPKITYEEVLKSLNQRDFNDINRKNSPLECAKDAIVFDNSNYSFEETIDELMKIIKERVSFNEVK